MLAPFLPPGRLASLVLTMSATKRRELNLRASDGVEVALLWDPRTNRLAVSVADFRTGDDFEVEVSSSEALDAFDHPYAYAASRGIHLVAGRPLEPATA